MGFDAWARAPENHALRLLQNPEHRSGTQGCSFKTFLGCRYSKSLQPQKQTPESAGLRGLSKSKRVGKNCLEHTFALCLFTRQFARTADRFGFLACFFLGRLFEMLLELHFTKNAFTLQLFLQSAERLIDVVVTNTNLHVVFTTFLSWICKDLQERAV
jgi:hypothetical protein